MAMRSQLEEGEVTLSFTPTMYPMAIRRAISSRTRVYTQSLLIWNPEAIHGTWCQQLRKGMVASVVVEEGAVEEDDEAMPVRGRHGVAL